MALPVAAACANASSLTMQRVGGEQHAREAELGHQLRHGCDLVRRPGQFLVCQDQGGVAGKGAEHMDGLAVGQVVEAAAQRLAVKRDRAQRFWGGACVQLAGMATEGRFEIVAAERQEQMAQGVDRRSAPEAGAKDGVQALALQGDEGDDLLIRGRARKRGENREQQQVAHAVALALGTARVGHLDECGKQESEWHRATSTKLEGRLHTAVASPRRSSRPGRYGRTEWPCLRERGQGAHSGQGPVLAILPMLAPKRGLRVGRGSGSNRTESAFQRVGCPGLLARD